MKNLLFILLVFIAGFSRYDKNPIPRIDLLSRVEADIQNLSAFATNVEYIPLQTNENSLIRYIYGLDICNNRIYINNLNKILVFDRAGKYLYKLDKNGRGPEEYNYINDFDVSQLNGLCLILDDKRILIYKDTGREIVFFKSIDLKNRSRNVDFAPDQKSIMLFFGSSNGDEPYRNMIINLNGETIKTIPNNYTYTKKTQMMFLSKS